MAAVEVKKHLYLLGLKVKECVSGLEGVVQSVCFDLYGCIQANVLLTKNKDGKLGEAYWFDVNRIKVISKKPVMVPPNLEYGDVAEGRHGPADKPKSTRF